MDAAPVDPNVVVDVRGLSKEFRFGFLSRSRRSALQNVTFDIRRREVFGYLGPNGSGKTTTLKLLMGLLSPDSGTATILGHPLASREWRYQAGYLPEHPYFYDYLSPNEYLDYAGRLLGMPASERRDRSRALLERVKLSSVANMPVRRFSKGMLQRLGLAQALVHDPELLFLDEPMSGLDPIGRRLVRDLILELKERGKTVFFSTHILSDAETLCDRVAVLRGGELLRVGALSEILSVDIAHMDVLVSGLSAEAVQRLGAHAKVQQSLGERYRFEVAEPQLAATVTAVQQAGGRILGIQAVRESLEDYFVREVGGAGKTNTWIVED